MSTLLGMANCCRLCGASRGFSCNGRVLNSFAQARFCLVVNSQRYASHSADQHGLTGYEARCEIRVHHAKARVKIKDWTRADKLDRIADFVSNMSNRSISTEVRTMNDIMKAFGTRTEYVPNAFKLLDKMLADGRKPNSRTLVQLFNMCAVHFPDHYNHVLHLHRMLHRRQIKVDLPVANAAIKAFAKYGDSTMALKIFLDMSKKDMTVAGDEEPGFVRVPSSSSRSRDSEESDLDGGLQPGQKISESGGSGMFEVPVGLVADLFTPYAELRPDVSTYVSLLNAAGRDSRHRLFRPAKFLAVYLPKLELQWTPERRRRYSLQMADAVWEHMTERTNVQLGPELFVAYLAAYRDGGRVDFMPLPKDFNTERHKQLMLQKGQLRRYDASHELMKMTGSKTAADSDQTYKVSLDDHLDLVYPDDDDDAKAAFWTDNFEALKEPLTGDEQAKQDKKMVVPLGDPAEFLRMMTAMSVGPSPAVFNVLWQCRVAAITGGPVHSRQPRKPEVLAALAALDPTDLVRQMEKYRCEPDEKFFSILLRHHAILRDYEGALRFLDTAQRFGVQLSTKHYRELAHACTSPEQGYDMLLDMQEHGLKPDAGTYECLVVAALNRAHYAWTLQILNLILKAVLQPTPLTVDMVKKALTKYSLPNPNIQDQAQRLHYIKLYHFFSGKFLPFVQPAEVSHDVEPDEDASAFLGLDDMPDEEEDSDSRPRSEEDFDEDDVPRRFRQRNPLDSL
eukprot:scpid45386/ scgid17002/ Pentatricopeptide repeat-containing protein 1